MFCARNRVSFDNVVQRFRVIRERPDTLRETFAHLFQRRTSYYDFEALKGVSFAVGDGEAVGIVGRNGSGKSTILRIIAGVYCPSGGVVTVSGKVAGLNRVRRRISPRFDRPGEHYFERPFTGVKHEVQKREERILEFAELGQFIDSPVKQYSSGMFMRLGFAVATEVNPDILLMDEILSVGDASFQRKCLQRIEIFASDVRRSSLFPMIWRRSGGFVSVCS